MPETTLNAVDWTVCPEHENVPAWQAQLDRLIPPEFLLDPKVRLRSRILVYLMGLGVISAVTAELAFLILTIGLDKGNMWLSHGAAVAMILVCLLSLVILKVGKSMSLAANTLLTSLFLVTAIFVGSLANVSAPPLFIWPLVVVLAFVIGGRRAGYIWLSVVMFSSLLVLALHASGFSFSFLPSPDLNPYYLSLAMLVGAYGVIGVACGINASAAEQYENRINSERDRFRKLSELDPLTGLLNRRAFYQLLNTLADEERDDIHQCSLIYIDLDKFKQVNDSLGHEAGDNVLVSVADRLGDAARDTDFIARLGGDEFAMVLLGTFTRESVVQRANSVLRALKVPIEGNGGEVCIGASAGIAIYPQHTDDILQLVPLADHSMFRAKTSSTRIVMTEQFINQPQAKAS